MKIPLKTFQNNPNPDHVQKMVGLCLEKSRQPFEMAFLKKIMNSIDLTSLSITDTEAKVKNLCQHVNEFQNKFPGIPNVAAICIYPVFVPVVKLNLFVPSVEIASVAGSFPSSQTFLDVKRQEVILAVDEGATEIDIVLNMGQFLSTHYELVEKEIKTLKEAAGKAKLKVILETGVLPDYSSVRTAAFLAMQAGADFIKTSTGKISPSATPDKFYIMLEAIRDYYQLTGKKVGIKPAGGIASAQDALLYYHLVKETLGKSWLQPDLFRIGASRLANNLITAILHPAKSDEAPVVYF